MSLAELARVYPPSLLARLPATAGYKLAENTTPAAVVAAVMSEVAAGRRFKVHEVKRRIAAAKPAESPVLPPEVDNVADRLLDALDPEDVAEVVAFLRSAQKPMIAVLCERLQHGLEQRPTPSTATLLPHPEL